jgi:glycosyltransferase involved in cell wall biosynthesis
MADYKGLAVAFISSWYPRVCGIATYTEHSASAIRLYEDEVRQIRIHPIDIDGLYYYDPVMEKHIIHQLDSSSWIDAAHMIIARYHRNYAEGIRSVAVLEHEYGLDGNGRDNNYNEVARRLKKAGVPNVVVLHTVLENPEAYHRDVIHQFGENCDRLIAISPSSREILEEVYAIPSEKISLIRHGIPETHKAVSRKEAKRKLGLTGRIVVSTMGLVSENKGIEYGLEGFSRFLGQVASEDRRRLVYVIAGQTHPEILKRHGWTDPYRGRLVELATKLGLNPAIVDKPQILDKPESHVIFVNRYLMENELVEAIKASDVILLPYINPQQDSSGNLAYAIGLGSAVVATKFRGARDLFTDKQGRPDGSGVMVDFMDSDGIASGLRNAFENHRGLERKSYVKGVTMGWSVVGRELVNVLRDVVEEQSGIESATISFLD